MRAYEIHTFRAGKWKMDSVFDDRELAVSDAERMESSRRFSGVRVIEETFDEDTNKTRTRTIYRGIQEVPARSRPGAETRSNRKPGKTAQGGGKKPARTTARKRKQKKERKKGLGFLILILALCLCGGAAALIALRMLVNAV